MKATTLILNILIFLFLIVSCNNSNSQKDVTATGTMTGLDQELSDTPIKVISAKALQSVKSAGAIQLIDVRTEKEWRSGHLTNARHIEINNPGWQEQINTLDKDKAVYVYCAKGGRSARFARQLQESGFKQIYDLKGGITAWKDAGMPIE